MFTRYACFAAFALVVTSGCDVYRGPLDEALLKQNGTLDRVDDESQDPHKPKLDVPPAPLSSSFGPACGCEQVHAAAYDDCVAAIRNPHVFAEAECGSHAQDTLVTCLDKCDESVCAGLDGRGFYEFTSENAQGHSQPVSCNEGLALCMGTSYVNKESVYCTWNGVYLLDSDDQQK